MMLLPRVFFLIYLLFISLWVSACGPNLAPLQRSVAEQNWQRAQQLVQVDAELLPHFAAMVIETEARKSKHPKPWVLMLPPGTDAGKAALERLAHDSSDRDSTLMAQIVLARENHALDEVAQRNWQDKASDVRALFATSFGYMLSADELLVRLEDVNATVRGAAVAALCRRKVTAAQAAQLSVRLQSDPLPHVRAAAARCAGALGKEALALLTETVQTDPNDGVVKAALEGLFRLGTAEATAFISSYADGPMTVRKVAAAVLLVRLGRSNQRLVDALDDTDEAVRVAAVKALRTISIEDESAALANALGDSSAVALAAAEVMLQKNVARDAAEAHLKACTKANTCDRKALFLLARAGDAESAATLIDEFSEDAIFVDAIARLNGVTGVREAVTVRLFSEVSAVRLAAAGWVLANIEE